ncbi:MAG: hypothetical protein VKO21_05645 [Candidatus Sericytochromatia bacterium]|nr:hypothetical protein [Candidatus Sericytochromatia bacterium]
MARWSFRGIEGQGICTPDGDSVGRVADVLWDPVEQRVIALRINWTDPEARSHGPSDDLPLGQIRRMASSAFEMAGLPDATPGLEFGTVTVGLRTSREILGHLLQDSTQKQQGHVVDVHFSDEEGEILAYELEDGRVWPPLDHLGIIRPNVWSGSGRGQPGQPLWGDSGPDLWREALPVLTSEHPSQDAAAEEGWGNPLQDSGGPRVE